MKNLFKLLIVSLSVLQTAQAMEKVKPEEKRVLVKILQHTIRLLLKHF